MLSLDAGSARKRKQWMNGRNREKANKYTD